MIQTTSNDAAVSLFLVDSVILNAQDGSFLEQFLSDAERSRAIELKDEGRRAEYVVAHATLRRLLAPRLNITPSEVQFASEANGRPCLHAAHASALQFSISHTSGLVALAVHPDARVGVDVESLAKRRDARALAQRFFHPQEKRYVDDAANESEAMLRLLRCWTMKEAWFKALGGSSSWVLSDLCFAFDDERSLVAPILPAAQGEGAFGLQLWSAAIATQHVVALAWRDTALVHPSAVHCVRLSALDLKEKPIDLEVKYAWPV
ncbi:MAG TPA: 4'-phosphopantetheinyl transferase superfamily protein [Polyangiaceae bacterium]|nr:4'-phosphopantetheinyl transferase superfamily protein [Polyangiaceae bacterium]